jgi:DNA uptake protein ComE-like DNA-binding protein
VTLGGDKTAQAADDWLLEPAEQRESEVREPESIDSEAAQWLVSPNGESNGQTATKTRPAAKSAQKLKRAKPKRADAKLKDAEASLAEQRATIAELESTLKQREAELEQTLKTQEAEFAQALRERDEALKERQADLEQELSQGYEKREADLNRQFDRRQVELEKQLAVLEDRLDAREAELRERATQREAKLMSRIEVLQSQLADAKLGMSETPEPKRRGGSKKNGQLDLNIASFEELRDLGLSVTQCARVIAYRDTRGGFDSLEELDEIPGLPKDTRGVLRNRLRL